jgi:hypothetical protein
MFGEKGKDYISVMDNVRIINNLTGINNCMDKAVYNNFASSLWGQQENGFLPMWT